MATTTTFYHDLYQNATTYLSGSTFPSDLYAGVDFSKLNTLELWWVWWYQQFSNPVVATGVMSFLMHELVYFGRSLPWIIIGQIRYFDQYKIQPNKVPTAQQQWKCTIEVLKSHFSVELPQIYLFHPMATAVGMKTFEVPFPSWQQIAFQIAVFFVVEDTWHYWAHRLFHYGPFYKHIHKQHHEFSAPFGLAAEYAHPVEVFTLGAGTVLAPLVYCYVSGDMHILTMYLWIVFRLFQAIDAHSGYDFPWSLSHWFPLWGGADHHDYHHEKFVENFSSSFRHWDYMFGTDKRYHAHRARQAEEKASLKAKAKAEAIEGKKDL